MTDNPFESIFGKGFPYDSIKFTEAASKNLDDKAVNLSPYIKEIKKYKCISAQLAKLLADRAVVPLEQNSDYWLEKAERLAHGG